MARTAGTRAVTKYPPNITVALASSGPPNGNRMPNMIAKIPAMMPAGNMTRPIRRCALKCRSRKLRLSWKGATR